MIQIYEHIQLVADIGSFRNVLDRKEHFLSCVVSKEKTNTAVAKNFEFVVDAGLHGAKIV